MIIVLCACNILHAATDHSCMNGAVRLVGGVVDSSSGLLEVCIDGVWGTVCDYFNEWNHENAAVACRQLNLPTSSKSLEVSCNLQTVSQPVYINRCLNITVLCVYFCY